MKKLFTLIGILFFCAAVLCAKTAVIYHTSDTHGFFYPDANGVGGAAALAAVLNKEKRPYLLLDSGDFANGAPEAAQSMGAKSVQVFNRLGYQAVTLGNHEYAFGEDVLGRLVRELQMPVLSANQRAAGLESVRLFDVGGVRMAVIGLGSDSARGEKYSSADLETSLDEVLTAMNKPIYCRNRPPEWQRMCRELSELIRPQVVVLLAHYSVEDRFHKNVDFLKTLPKRFAGRIHVVLGGHAHNVIQGRKINGMYFVESGEKFKGVSRIEIKTDNQTGLFKGVSSRYIELNERKTGADPAMKAFLDELRLKELDETVGSCADKMTFYPRCARERDSALGNWAADVVRQTAQTEVGINNNGGLRRSFVEKGPVLLRDVEELYPFHNTRIMTMRVSGAFLKRFVQEDLAREFSIFSFSGLTVQFSPAQSDGTSALYIKVNGLDLEEDRLYSLAVNEYIGSGKGEGYLFKQIATQDKVLLDGPGMFDAFRAAFAAGARAPDTGRVRQM